MEKLCLLLITLTSMVLALPPVRPVMPSVAHILLDSFTILIR